jgi:N-acetylglucosaminyl-diphospho-decaprenol L-rhamnosyltransferase
VAVVIVAHDCARALPATLTALTPQLCDGDELLVVDCASRDATTTIARQHGAAVLELDENRGFAGGCNAGADATTAPLLILLNPDAVPAPGFLTVMRRPGADRPRWGAWQALVVLPGGEEVNTEGNVVHYLGFGWAGGLGTPAVRSRERGPREVAFPSGAAMAVRRQAWDAVGGFEPRYFMYGEDLDLGLRLRLAGWRVGVQPDAIAEHDYEFAKGDYKWFWMERNRAWTVLGAYPAPLLAALAPALLAFELALLIYAWRGGWLRAKLRAQATVIRELRAIVRRRRAIQRTRAVSVAWFAAALTASLDSPNLPNVPVLTQLQAAFWRVLLVALR